MLPLGKFGRRRDSFAVHLAHGVPERILVLELQRVRTSPRSVANVAVASGFDEMRIRRNDTFLQQSLLARETNTFHLVLGIRRWTVLDLDDFSVRHNT